MEDVLLARQPIFDKKQNVVAYELLFRNSEDFSAEFEDGDDATSNVIINTFVHMGIGKVTGLKPAYINITKNLLTSLSSLPIQPEHVILEILEDIEVDDDVISAISSLKKQGFKFALDDFVLTENCLPLIELADIIKIDIQSLSKDDIISTIERLQPNSPILLAEKIESQEELDFCMAQPFEQFQGYYLSHPKIVQSSAETKSNRVAIMRLLSILHNPKSTPREIADAISLDARLSYKLLKLINSAAFHLVRKIDSLRDAVIFIGHEQIKSWATLLSFAELPGFNHELLRQTMIRAKFCELMSPQGEHQSFTVGLLSTLDELLMIPMEKILRELPLNIEVTQAIQHRHGPTGELLSLAIAQEKGDWINKVFESYETDKIRESYLKSLEWCEACYQEM